MSEHSSIGPSALYRLLACPGSYQQAKVLRPGKSSIYAAEGTVAHEIASEMLEQGTPDAISYLGEIRSADGFDFEVDAEMVEGVNLYVRHCRDQRPPKGHKSMEIIEQRVTLDNLWAPNTPPEPIFGTTDHAVFDFTKSRLAISDLKYGRGDISPDDNPQALAYALGTMLTYGIVPTIIDIYIVQPRGAKTQGVKHWQTTGLDLLEWGHSVLKPGVEKLVQPDAMLVPGNHCKFCPALSSCPAVKTLAQKTSKTEFDPIPPNPAEFTDEELGDLLDRAELLRDWVAALQAEASARLDQGKAIPGWKLVPKRASRKWGDAKAVEAWATEHAPGAFKQVLETPTQIEKKLPDVYETLAEMGYIDSSSSGTTLVADHDPREALIARRAKDEFKEIT